jgi:hypothetical protein
VNQTLQAIVALLEPFRHPNPSGWFSFSEHLDQGPATALLVVGLLLAVLGGQERFWRFISPPMGLVLGLVLGPWLVEALDAWVKIPPVVGSVGVPLAIALIAGFAPTIVLFIALGAVGARIGAEFFPDSEKIVGAAPGFLLTGALSLAIGRFIMTLLTSLIGAVMIAGAAAPLLGKTGAGAMLQGNGQLVAAAVIAVVAAAFQLVTHKDHEQRIAEAGEKREKKLRAKDAAERAKRFEGYRK